MKKMFIALLVLLIGTLCLSCTALAATTTSPLVLITASQGAVMYDNVDLDVAIPIALIPKDSVAVRLVTIDWGYCVTFGNYAGYIRFEDCKRVSSEYYEYELPDGTDYSLGSNSATSEVPEFPYSAQPCYGIDNIATRSGPGGGYTYHDRYPMDTDLEIFYQVEKGGVQWCYLEFEAKNTRYRLYTSMRRVEVDGYVPSDTDDYVWVRITKQHTPRFGPGYEYAAASKSVPAVKVKGFYQENGWLLYEYTLNNGEIQRGWAPPGYWK